MHVYAIFTYTMFYFSHDVAAPLNPQLMEVSGYIDHNVSMDSQFGFRLEILNPDNSGTWKAVHSQIRLVHVNTSASIKVCYTIACRKNFFSNVISPWPLMMVSLW